MPLELPPIVKLAERVTAQLEEAIIRFPRRHRYSLGTDLRASAMRVYCCAYRAWRDRVCGLVPEGIRGGARNSQRRRATVIGTAVIGNAILYHGDAREILPTLQAEVVMTDPVWPNCPAGLIPGSDRPRELFAEACAAMRPPTRMVVVMRHDSDPRFLQPVPLPYIRAAWLPYVMPGYIGRMLGGDEIAYCFGKPIPSRPGQRVIPGRAEPEQPAGRKANGHPCSRAIGHFRWLTRWWSEDGETILDPFMGSGTTGEATVGTGRKFIGIEIDEKYFDIACRRLDRAQQQQRLPLTVDGAP